MSKMKAFKLNRLAAGLLLALLGMQTSAQAVEFNTDILDAEDRGNVDLSRFAESAYIMPGTYTMTIKVNDHSIKDEDITFIERPDKQQENKPVPVEACLSEEQIKLLGLKPDVIEKLTRWNDGKCVDFSAIPGIELEGDLSDASLKITIPQAFLEYQDANWLPPSRWENGIAGVLLDYNFNASLTKPNDGQQSQNISGTGTAGMNLGAWRLRGDWQSAYYRSAGENGANRQSFDWSRLYAFRDLRDITAKLTVGEDYINSSIFDSWRYVGVSVVSDESMLPPKLRGYAPEVTGIAKTNAKVIISQQGRVIYQTTVASGPFRIQDLSDALSGKLDVRVEEQDGGVQTFQVDTASVPYLTRAGQVRYKIAMGRPNDYDHHMEGPGFGTGEFSWGLNNIWSLYGGTIVAGDYNALAAGVGRDLLSFGAISADITQSVARLPGEGTLEGKSWRFSYSKRFEEISSEVTFAGYRFSEKNYLSMDEFIDARYRNNSIHHDKELYTVTGSKSFTDLRMSAYLSWSHQTYWDSKDSDRYSFSVSRYFDVGDFHNLSASLSVSRSEYNNRQDDAGYLSISMPLSNGTVSYNGSLNNDRYSQTAGWYQRMENNDSYRVQAGTRTGNGENTTTQFNGYYNHSGDVADMTANVGWAQDYYSSAGLSLTGGVTATMEGVAAHPGSVHGGTRLMVSTDGVAGVPVERKQHTNAFGVAVIPNVPNYYPDTASIDVNNLPDDVEAAGSPVAEVALTEGAIGFRKFDVLKGAKLIAVLTMADGSHPPFGASIQNSANRELGIVSDGGLSWISGVSPDEELTVKWGSTGECKVKIPGTVSTAKVLLPCH